MGEIQDNVEGLLGAKESTIEASKCINISQDDIIEI